MTTHQARKWAYWAIHARRPLHQPRGAYTKVGAEFGVASDMVRRICGPIGLGLLNFDERVAMLRAKMDNAGFAPVDVNTVDIPDKENEPGEPRELRSCVLCEQFLEDDDAGGDVVDPEHSEQHAYLCAKCRTIRDRM